MCFINPKELCSILNLARVLQVPKDNETLDGEAPNCERKEVGKRVPYFIIEG